jgi:hypothetical protein
MCSHNHWFQLLYQWKNIHAIKEKIFGGIFMEGEEKEKSCLSAIYVDFSKYLSLEECV